MFIVNIHAEDTYDKTVSTWKSYKDVANWMKDNWEYNLSETKRQIRKIKQGGPLASTTISAEETFKRKEGWCKDATVFIRDTLNKINPSYKAQLLLIKNAQGFPHHWVTGFYVNGKLYIMDYGASSHWSEIMGTHGPYNNLDEYGKFLSSSNLNNFTFDFAIWK